MGEVMSQLIPELVLSVTNRCNLRCLTCPQEEDENKNFHQQNLAKLQYALNSGRISQLVLTGGEPLLNKSRLEDILNVVASSDGLPNLRILTNATCIDEDVINLLNSYEGEIFIETTLYGCESSTHEEHTGSKGSFIKLLHGLVFFNSAGFSVNIRILITAMNYSYLPLFPAFLKRYLPFVNSVSLMGMEVRHSALTNRSKLLGNMNDLLAFLPDTVRGFELRGISTNIFNIPPCYLHPDIRHLSVPSISEWKIQPCDVSYSCELADLCPGKFGTSQIDIYPDTHSIGGIEQ